ncbi:MAG: PilN domain-containing protein [Proteobacteria bacterium]|nr:PilN domain-containing protein [Pseudomonadota bacterium]
MILQWFLENRNPKKIILLHGDSVSLFEDNSLAGISIGNDLIQTLKDCGNSQLLFAAPFAYTHVQETVHLKRNELQQADRQTLEFSRFRNQNRILESTAISKETAITTFTHLSERAVKLIQKIKSNKLKLSWKPAIAHLIQQHIKYSTEGSQHNLELILDQEILHMGWKDSRICCRHLYFWPQNGSHNEKSARAKNVLQSDYAASILSSIDLHNIGNNTSHLDLLCQGLLFPPQKPKQVKSVRKATKSRNKTVFKRAHIKFLAVALTCLLVVWAIGLKIQLQELRAERSQLNKTVRALRHSSAKLEQMASGERSLVKAESLADTLKRNSIESTDLIDRLQLLLPETSWIKSLKMKQKTIQIQILDTENSSISEQLTSLSKALGNVELENNSNLVIDNMSLRARTFTIHLK